MSGAPSGQAPARPVRRGTASGEAPRRARRPGATAAPKPAALALVGAVGLVRRGRPAEVRRRRGPSTATPPPAGRRGATTEKGEWIEVTFAPSTVTSLILTNGYNASAAALPGQQAAQGHRDHHRRRGADQGPPRRHGQAAEGQRHGRRRGFDPPDHDRLDLPRRRRPCPGPRSTTRRWARSWSSESRGLDDDPGSCPYPPRPMTGERPVGESPHERHRRGAGARGLAASAARRWPAAIVVGGIVVGRARAAAFIARGGSGGPAGHRRPASSPSTRVPTAARRC